MVSAKPSQGLRFLFHPLILTKDQYVTLNPKPLDPKPLNPEPRGHQHPGLRLHRGLGGLSSLLPQLLRADPQEVVRFRV